MTIADKLTQLNSVKQDIKTAINGKGGSVGSNFSTYAAAITALPSSGGGLIEFGKPEIVTVKPFDSTVKTISSRNFQGWVAPTGLVIGEGIETIKDWAFSGWINAETLVFPVSLLAIKDNAFSGCE